MKAHNNFDGSGPARILAGDLAVGNRAINIDAFEKRQHPSAATGPLD
jgi:hypothetical protein